MRPEERTLREESKTAQKKPYTAPLLTVHGDAQEITRGLSGGGTDGQSGSQPADD